MSLSLTPPTSERVTCCLCFKANLSPLWQLDNLPFTDTLGEYTDGYPAIDQTLMICDACGMVQLLKVVAPKFLYNPLNYNYERISGPKITQEANLYKDLLQEFFSDEKARETKVLEIGGSSELFMNEIVGLFECGIIVDPAPIIPNHQNPKISFVKGFMENNLDLVANKEINLIICRHVIEHVPNPRDFIASILDSATEDALFVFETPNFDSLQIKMRLDAIFHQHVNYFDPNTFRHLIESSGGQIAKEVLLENGSNGGVMIFLFWKSNKFTNKKLLKVNTLTLISKFEHALLTFRKSIDSLNLKIDSIQDNYYGIGAGSLLPILNYHLDGRIIKSLGIIDDNLKKDGMTYKNVNLLIHSPEILKEKLSFNCLITSLENRKLLYGRANALGFKNIMFIPPLD